MKLTDKAREDFEKWLKEHIVYCSVPNVVEWFYEMPNSMKWGVIVDWAYSVGIHIGMYPEAYKDGVNTLIQVFEYDSTTHDCWSNNSTGAYGDNGMKLPQAMEKAIEKLNEIYNGQTK